MQAVDNLMFMGRRLSVKWFSPERALEGNVGGVADVLNMQALQQALQLSAQLQPADFMTQLAQMLEPARPHAPQQQQQNPHVAAWLDNFMMSVSRVSCVRGSGKPPRADVASDTTSGLGVSGVRDGLQTWHMPCDAKGVALGYPNGSGQVFTSRSHRSRRVGRRTAAARPSSPRHIPPA